MKIICERQVYAKIKHQIYIFNCDNWGTDFNLVSK